MGYKFLQQFYEDEILAEVVHHSVGREGHRQALHLAMLGLADEAHAIFTLMHAHDLPSPMLWTWAIVTALFYHASGLEPPYSRDTTPDVAASQLDAMKHAVGYFSEGFDLEQVTEESYEKLQGVSIALKNEEYSDEETGYAAVRRSAALTTLLYMADKLGKEKDVWELLGAMTTRLHANQQAEYLSYTLVAWEKWHLPGKLREALGVELSELRSYADFVHATLKKRLENGPVRPDDVYAGFSVRSLLEELDRNTTKDQEFDYHDFYCEGDDVPTTIFKEPASEGSIEAKEKDLGRKLPEELKELLRASNGCEMVKTAPGERATRFVALEDIYIEDDDFVDGYGFTMLPDFEVEPNRPCGVDEEDWEFSFRVRPCKNGGGIAAYKQDGQGTRYIWILPNATVDDAREKVKEVWGKVSDEQKARIDEEIVRRYGSRETYEGMEYAVNVQQWGCPEGVEVYPNYGSFIRAVTYRSRVKVEKSPVKRG